MIAFVKGELVTVNQKFIVVENQGIGYEILVPLTVAENLPQVGNEVKIYTYLYVREDILQLYGFRTRDEMDMFKLLITVNGVGPKGALGILSVMDVDTLRFTILSEDAKSIAKAPGIGAKTASKVILELRDKCHIEDMMEASDQNHVISNQSGNHQTAIQDAVQALVALGYSSSDALKAVHKVNVTEDMNVEDILKASLKTIY